MLQVVTDGFTSPINRLRLFAVCIICIPQHHSRNVLRERHKLRKVQPIMLEYLGTTKASQVLYVKPRVLGLRKAVHLYRGVGMTCEVIFGVDTLVEVVGNP